MAAMLKFLVLLCTLLEPASSKRRMSNTVFAVKKLKKTYSKILTSPADAYEVTFAKLDPDWMDLSDSEDLVVDMTMVAAPLNKVKKSRLHQMSKSIKRPWKKLTRRQKIKRGFKANYGESVKDLQQDFNVEVKERKSAGNFRGMKKEKEIFLNRANKKHFLKVRTALSTAVLYAQVKLLLSNEFLLTTLSGVDTKSLHVMIRNIKKNYFLDNSTCTSDTNIHMICSRANPTTPLEHLFLPALAEGTQMELEEDVQELGDHLISMLSSADKVRFRAAMNSAGGLLQLTNAAHTLWLLEPGSPLIFKALAFVNGLGGAYVAVKSYHQWQQAATLAIEVRTLYLQVEESVAQCNVTMQKLNNKHLWFPRALGDEVVGLFGMLWTQFTNTKEYIEAAAWSATKEHIEAAAWSAAKAEL